MPLTESLIVQILGDSSGLRDELASVADLLEGLESQFTAVEDAAQALDEGFSGLSGALAPLQALSAELTLVTQQIQALSGQTITLNVAPALAALQELMQAAQAAAQQLAALGAAAVTPAGWGGGIGAAALADDAPAATSAEAGFASGGLVSGPSGIDQVPARLTAGEYVLSRDAVSVLGLSALDHLNRAPWNPAATVTSPPLPPRATGTGSAPTSSTTVFQALSHPADLPSPAPLPSLAPATPPVIAPAAPPVVADSARRPAPAPAASSVSERTATLRNTPSSPAAPQTTNQFGGIEIHVRDAADVADLMFDLRRQGIGLKNRRG